MKRVTPALAAAFVAASCNPYAQVAPDRSKLEAEIAARQGPEVDRICFAREINGWRELSRDSILIEKGVDDWYLLELTGTCDPGNAFDAIAIRTRPAGSLCLSAGDSIKTIDTPITDSCFISSIHEWNEDAKVTESEAD